jgi:hypothetical protein
MRIIKYLKCRIIGWYNKLTTGVCGGHLYYDGCDCDTCNSLYSNQYNDFKNTIKEKDLKRELERNL